MIMMEKLDTLLTEQEERLQELQLELQLEQLLVLLWQQQLA